MLFTSKGSLSSYLDVPVFHTPALLSRVHVLSCPPEDTDLRFRLQCVCSDPCAVSAASESPVFGWARFSFRAFSRWPGGLWPLTSI